jgi:hypothetical protein
MARGAALRQLRTVPDGRVAIALLFACALAAPRAPLVHHHHAGGARAHAHGGALLAEPLAHGGVVHRDAPAAGRRDRPVVAGAGRAADGHVHHQDRYQAAVAPAAPLATVAAPLAPLPRRDQRRAPARAAAAPNARGPPHAPLV